MQVFTFTCSDPNVPPGSRAIAKIRASIGGGRVDWMPLIVFGATEEEARAKAEAFWEEGQRREREKKPRGRPKKTEAELVGEVI